MFSTFKSVAALTLALSLGERGQEFCSLLPEREGLGMRASSCHHSAMPLVILIWTMDTTDRFAKVADYKHLPI
jgi:hypothetical protein